MNNITGAVTSGSLVKTYIKRVLSYKFFYITCIVLFLAITYFINKYTSSVYQVESTLIIKPDDKTSALNASDLFRGAEMLQTNKNIEDEIVMLNSFSLVSSAVTGLNLEVSYYKEKRGIFTETTDLYKETPFVVEMDKSHVQPIYVKFYIEPLTDSTFRVQASKEDVDFYNYIDNAVIKRLAKFSIDSVYKFGHPITNSFLKLTVSRNPEVNFDPKDSKKRYYFMLNHLDYLAMNFLDLMKVEPISPLSSVITIKCKGRNLNLITDFLNEYLDFYLNNNLNKKNKKAVNTVNFIDSQISDISDSLVLAESRLRNYRTSNQVTDLSFQGQRIFERKAQLETEKANLQEQKRYYTYIIEYFEKNKEFSGLVPPSKMNVVDPIMNQLITELLSLNAQMAGILNDNSQKNLFLPQIENKIKVQKETILENVKNNLNTVDLSINELNYRSDKLSRDIAALPRTELGLVGIERNYKLNDAIYTFLLQRRAEAEIVKASNYPDYEIIEPARSLTSSIIAPRRNVNYLIALFLALLFPTGYILVKDFLNDKVTSTYDLEHMLKRKVIGVIYKNKHKTEAVVVERPRSSVSESFRTLRTNLLIKLSAEPSVSILVTSSLPREGKSFVSFNLASSLASIGNSTVIVDADLRKPTLHLKFKVDNSIGLSSYMANKAVIDDIIIQNTLVPNLSFIPAGPILPNPAELIESGACDKLFAYLKKHFNFIIIDTPPLGAVADSFLLMKYASQALVIVRQDYTRKDILAEVASGIDSNNLLKYDIVLNDLNYKKSSYGKYYGRYYNDEK